MADLSDNGKRLLNELFARTGGDTAATESMFDVGEAAGLNRDQAGAAGEELIGWGLVEVRTLSGGIAIAESGIEAAHNMGGGAQTGDQAGFQLGAAPVLDDAGTQTVDRIVSKVKSRAESLGLGFERLSELVADLKSIDAQLASPRPKTALIKEGFRSILAILESTDAGQESAEIRRLLGE